MHIGKFLRRSLAVVAAATCAWSAHANLARVGPVDPAHGFPAWYQDFTGRVLDLCLQDPNDTGEQATACLVTNPSPLAFPNNFPDEAFYFRAVSDAITVGVTNPKRMVMVLAVEAAFANGGVAAGDQMVFTRIRVTSGVPQDGDYTVTHPYGVETFVGVTAGAGNRDIVFSEDVGITAGNFTEALTSRFGPAFLAPANPDGTPGPLVTIGGAQFLGDGLNPVQARGGPEPSSRRIINAATGAYVNFVMICGTSDPVTPGGPRVPITLGNFGPGGPGTGNCAGTELWNLTGRLHNNAVDPIGTPLAIDRATYSRDGTGTHLDVYASVVKAVGTEPTPVLHAGAAEAPPRTMRADASNTATTFRFMSQDIIASGNHPGVVTVINTADSPPTAMTAAAHDVVTILSANFSSAGLVVTASSSDKGKAGSTASTPAPDGPPRLTLEIRGTTVQGTVNANGNTVFTVPGQTTPATITVRSSAGGQASADVTSSQVVGAYNLGPPLAADDSKLFTRSATGTLTPFNGAIRVGDAGTFCWSVLDNDIGTSPTSAITALAPGVPAEILNTVGTNAATGVYCFTSGTAPRTLTFRYTVNNASGLSSNPAVVAADVVASSIPTPLAGNTSANVSPGQSVVINLPVSANGGTLETVVNGGLVVGGSSATPIAVSGGTVTALSVDPVAGTASLTFTAGATAGNFAFPYTVRNTNGQVSNPAGQVSVVVAAENLVVNAAASECRRTNNRWRVTGTSNVSPNTITLRSSTGAVVGSAPVTLGAFTIDVIGGPPCTATASVTSSTGRTVNFTIGRVR